MKEALAQRKEKKAKQPHFERHAAHRKPKLGNKWRKPKGLQNKLRLNKRGHRRRVRVGYRSPAIVRDLAADGKKIATVSTVAEIVNVEPETHALIIASVGDKRRLELLEAAKKQGFDVLNHDVDERIAEIKERSSARSKKRSERESKRAELEKESKKKADAAKKAEADKKAEAAKSDEEKAEEKVAEKKEQDKVLTKKEM